MSSNTIYHYTYRITNLVEGKHYYGSRTSKVHPSKDLGKKYFSSSLDKDFIKDQKENPQNYKYKVIKIFDTREEAISFEIKLHDKFDVGLNESFYNRCKQTSVGWDVSGMVSVRDTVTGETLQCTKDNPRYLSKRYVCINTGMIGVRDTSTGETLQCSVEDPNYLSGVYANFNVGMVSVRDIETGETLQCSVEDPNYLSGKYVGIAKDMASVRDTVTGETLQCSVEDPLYLSGRYVSVIKGKHTVIDTVTGETLQCSVEDPNYLSGRYVSINTGKIAVKDTLTGEKLQCSADDPNYLSGRYIGVSKGSKLSEETKRKISESQKGIPKPQPKVKCMYCDMETSKTNIKRWHNENCKHKTKDL